MSTITPLKTVSAPAQKDEIEEKSKPTESTQYYDATGDLQLLSSDNVLFRIHAYRLQASSSVFRDMMQSRSSASSECIELSDPAIETSRVITGLLDIMIEDTDILDIVPDNIRSQVILFALKYDFVNEIRIIKYQLNVAVSSCEARKRDPRPIFHIASMLDAQTLCTNAIKKAGAGWNWTVGDEPNQEKLFGVQLKGGKIFDLTTSPLSDLRDMPIEVIWALLRASHKPNTLTGAALQAERDAMAERYAKLMKLPGAPKFA